MTDRTALSSFLLLSAAFLMPFRAAPAAATNVPRFSIEYMDRSVPPSVGFYLFADGNWLKNNPVPPDKSRWGAFNELQERNWQLIRSILEACATNTSAPAKTPTREVGEFFASSMDTNRLEQLGFKPISSDLQHIARLHATE